jgi:hypothetical protein
MARSLPKNSIIDNELFLKSDKFDYNLFKKNIINFIEKRGKFIMMFLRRNNRCKFNNINEIFYCEENNNLVILFEYEKKFYLTDGITYELMKNNKSQGFYFSSVLNYSESIFATMEEAIEAFVINEHTFRPRITNKEFLIDYCINKILEFKKLYSVNEETNFEKLFQYYLLKEHNIENEVNEMLLKYSMIKLNLLSFN